MNDIATDFSNDNVLAALNPDFVCADHAAILNDLGDDPTKPLNPQSPIIARYLSDNGGELSYDQAIDEIEQRLDEVSYAASNLSDSLLIAQKYVNTPAQNSIASGFNLAQLSQKRLDRVGSYFLNCAPREEERGQEGDNQGESVFIGMLENGAAISGTGPKIFWAFRPQLESGDLRLYKANVQTNNTQFRSLNVFPTFKILLDNLLQKNIEGWRPGLSVEDRESLLAKANFIDVEDTLSTDSIPDFSLKDHWIVAMQENNGNLKLSFTKNDIAEQCPELINGEPVAVKLGDRTPFITQFRDQMFDAPELSPAFYAGSSGAWGKQNLDREERRNHFFVELGLIGGKLSEALEIEKGENQGELQRGLPVLIRPATPDEAERYKASLEEPVPGIVHS